jgi:hypothetical protein
MTCDQQHNIRNGIINVCTLLRWLLARDDLTALQRRYIEEAMTEASRVETAACVIGSCEEKSGAMDHPRTHRWGPMTMVKRLFRMFCLAVLIALTVCAIGCASIGTAAPPAGCEKSVLYSNAPYAFIALSSARIAAGTLLTPTQYKLAALSAHVLADTLESNPSATIETIASVPAWSKVLIADLAIWFRPGEVLNHCDKDALIGYLRSF